MAQIGGGATTSTGHVKEHTQRAPATPTGGPVGRNRVGGGKTVSTGSAHDSVLKSQPASHRAGTANPIGGGTTSTGDVGRHINRAPDGRGGPGSPSGKTGGYPIAGKGGRGSGK